MRLESKALVVAITALLYFLFFELNSVLFSSLHYAKAVDWIFLPSGLCLLFILLFGTAGATGIALSSFVLGYTYYFQGDPVTSLGAALVSGFSPLIAKKLGERWFGLDERLEKLSSRILIKLAFVFALTSAALHQAWYSLRLDGEKSVLGQFVAMTVGDFLGSLIVLYLVRFALVWLLPGNRQGRH